MKARVWVAVVAAALFVSLAAADEPWMSKASKDWSKEDTEKILNDSPWGRRIGTAVEYTTEKDKSTGGKKTVSDTDRGEQRETDFALVLWWSARTTRRAFLRMFELGGNSVSQEQAQKFAENPMPQFVVSVIGGGKMVEVSSKLEENELKKAAWLESPRIKKHIDPVDVIVVKDGNGRAERINFVFARETDGQPTVTAEDKKIIFKWRLPKTPSETVEKAKQFQVQFLPSKMTASGAADF